MAKHKVDRAASEGADEAVLNLQQVDALAELKKKIEGVEEQAEQSAEAPAADAVSSEEASADTIVLAAADSVFASDASHVMVAQAGGGSTGGSAGGLSTGTLVAIGAGVVGAGAIAVAVADDDSDGGGSGGNNNPTVQSVTATRGGDTVTSVDENGNNNSVTFVIQTDGTGGIVNFEILGLSANDIASVNNSSSNVLSGTTQVDSSGRALVTVVLAADSTTEGPESLQLRVTGAAGGPVTSAAVTVNDTSTAEPSGDTEIDVTPNVTNVTEGQTVTFAFNPSNVPEGAVVSYAITGVNASQLTFVSGQQGNIQLNGFLSDFSPLAITVRNDGVVGGPESLVLTVFVNGTEVGTSTVGIIDPGATPTANARDSLTIVEGEAAGAAVLGLRGDQDIRIDFTNPARQITGLDLDGNGVIAQNGIENNIQAGNAALGGAPIGGYVIVDAYARNPLNSDGRLATRDLDNNFYGDINFDGTGFNGDGVSTDGNIVLGGFGADTIFGGIGNDFLAGGGVGGGAGGSTDVLRGGRNADFFFAELSQLSFVDGDALFIDGGNTFDDDEGQDSDWLLVEASDDDEPVVINLSTASLRTRAGEGGTINDIENVDASGNLYGFLNDLDVNLGGRALDVLDGRADSHVVGTENVGIGSSAQLLITGTEGRNILIGGFDNDTIDGGAGNDLLFGGNLAYLNNANLQGIVDDGRDVLIGGDDDDSIVFEADGGQIYGGRQNRTDNDNRVAEAQAATGDTLYLTNLSLGRDATTGDARSADDLTTDGVLRFDLQAGTGATSAASGSPSGYAGYGGADVDTTADQTNYVNAAQRVTVLDIENVIATGLGQVDYLAAGTNDPDLLFNNQQNHFAYNGDLDLRGTDESNVLYASDGDDVIEGRQGNDFLSGGNGNDDFVFELGAGHGDGVDVIHRQLDADNNNIWDRNAAGVGLFGQDFGLDSTATLGASQLVVDFRTTDFTSPNVAITSFTLTIGGEEFSVPLADLLGVNSIQELIAVVNAAFNAQDADITVTAVNTLANGLQVIDAQGREISDTIAEGYLVGGTVANGNFESFATFNEAIVTVSQDRLIYQSYEDRFDGEKTNDDTQNGSFISLGVDNYAQDLVVSFGPDGTRLAEDQQYELTFDNLTTQDVVSIAINGVNYSLTVGRNLDGSIIAAEDTASGAAQPAIQDAFLARLVNFINTFADTNTAAGRILAAAPTDSDGDGNLDTFAIVQATYNGEQTVFVSTPVVTIANISGGQPATAEVVNVSQHEVLLYQFDGRDNNLNAENVLFLGDTGISRAVFETASNAGGLLTGSNAVVVDNGTADLDSRGAAGFVEAFVNPNTNSQLVVNNFTVHGDDFLIGGDGNDQIVAGTGDDRIHGSRGDDTINGGKDLYSVRIGSDPIGVFRVIELNLSKPKFCPPSPTSRSCPPDLLRWPALPIWPAMSRARSI